MPVFVFLVIVLFTYTFFIFNAERGKASFDVGEPYVGLVKIYEDAEGDLFYLETCVRYAEYRAVERFFSEGGVLSECDSEWKFGDDCEPDFENDFIVYLKEETGLCGVVEDVRLNGDNVFVNLEKIEYKRQAGKAEIDYAVEPFFEQDAGFSFTKLVVLKEKVKNCLRQSDFDGCVAGFDGLKNDGVADGITYFSYDLLNEEIPIISGGVIEMKKPLFKFKINAAEQGREIVI